VPIEIIEESVAALPEYEKVPIAFRVESHLIIVPIDNGLGGLKFVEKAVTPYIKDYDANANNRPAQWYKRFDISPWGILAAFDGAKRVGGAAVAWRTPELSPPGRQNDIACLWDLRVHPDYRNQGIGHNLFTRALTWSSERSCRRIKIETQNINVPACRFYARRDCELAGIDGYAYETIDEIQLLWYRDV
jgi:GNAT superfamily N-acetyltransferase